MTAVQWLSNRAYELFEEYSEGKFDRIRLNKLMVEATEQAKEMEKEQKIFDYSTGWHDGQDIILNQIKHVEIGGDAAGENYYNETYGGNK